jgi:Glycosyltransferase
MTATSSPSSDQSSVSARARLDSQHPWSPDDRQSGDLSADALAARVGGRRPRVLSVVLVVSPGARAGHDRGPRHEQAHRSPLPQRRSGDHLANWGTARSSMARTGDEIVVPSEYLRDVFARHGYPTRVIPNVVDLSKFQYRERRPLQPRVLSARNLERYYRVDLVIEAFARFSAEVPAATLTVAGYGSEEGRLRGLAASLGGDAIRFAGRIDPAASRSCIRPARHLRQRGVLDNQPVSILEAFRRGCRWSRLQRATFR